jgi:hypothetical protein
VSTVNELTGSHALDAPARSRHVAQFYTQDETLVRVVGDFVTTGLRRGEAVVLITTAAHRAAIARHLEGQGFTPSVLARRRQLTLLDARETLEALCAGTVPDRARFETVIGGAIEEFQRAGFERRRAFGEMVELLRRDNDLEAALHLEALWNDLAAARGLTLLCGYGIDAFDHQTYRGLPQRVSAKHSHPVPVEDSASLEHAVECAYHDIFGAGRDAAILRRLFLANYRRPSDMPEAQAAILAAHEFVPEAAAALLGRIRYHYRLARTVA